MTRWSPEDVRRAIFVAAVGLFLVIMATKTGPS
jgi:hypothetical protein